MPSSDVTIIGAGIFGLWSAWFCLERGLSVRVLDTGKPGSGASGGPFAALAPHMPDRWNAKKAFQRDALRALPDDIAVVEATGGGDFGYRACGRLQNIVGRDIAARVASRVTGAGEHWRGWGRLEQADPGDWSHWFGTAEGVLLRDTVSASLSPPGAVQALVRAIEARGGVVEHGVAVQSVASGVIRCANGAISAGAIVVAAGANSFDLIRQSGGPELGRGEKGQAALLASDWPVDAPLVQTDRLWIVPQGAGRIAVGSTSERAYADPRRTDGLLDDLIAHARVACPVLRDADVIGRWAGERPRGNGRDPVLGPIAALPGVFVATGGFKIGFALAAAIGRIVAASVAGDGVEMPDSFAVGAHLVAD